MKRRASTASFEDQGELVVEIMLSPGTQPAVGRALHPPLLGLIEYVITPAADEALDGAEQPVSLSFRGMWRSVSGWIGHKPLQSAVEIHNVQFALLILAKADHFESCVHEFLMPSDRVPSCRNAQILPVSKSP